MAKITDYETVKQMKLGGHEIMACDLAEEANKHPHEYALVELDGEAQRLEVLYLPTLQRVGFAWGGPAEWEDAQSMREAIEAATAAVRDTDVDH